jgi:hypothetical protein
MTDPIEPQYFAKMNDIGKTLDRLLNGDERPRHTGFVLLMFEFGADKRMNYLSNAERADMLSALKELVANFEGRAVDYHGRG